MDKEEEFMMWLDNLRVVDDKISIGAKTDNDYALITDRNGKPWTTETLPSGEQVKIDGKHTLEVASKVFNG